MEDGVREIAVEDAASHGSTEKQAHTGSNGFTSSISKFSGTTDGDSSIKTNPLAERGTSKQPAKPSQNEKTRSLNLLLSKSFDETVSFQTKLRWLNRVASLNGDGTVELDLPEEIEPPSSHLETRVVYGAPVEEEEEDGSTDSIPPPMQIVMLIVGTRGDVQPFIAIGNRLKEHGHRVRLATHSNFKDFVLAGGLEFFPLGGDPKVLSEYMIKNKGFLPSDASEIFVLKKQIKDILDSLYPACTDPDPDSNDPFKPDAIIANPPVYGHTHVAEALKVPLHIFFTMPWTPTSEFPHPLSRGAQAQPIVNWLSYHLVDMLIWAGMLDIISDFRKKTLKLRRACSQNGPRSSLHFPHGYIWSSLLVPKPQDWGPKIDVVGFCFLDLALNYKPPQELEEWLSEDERKPIYIGFGSMTVQEPKKMTEMIVQALEETGQRGIINKGWGDLGTVSDRKDFVYLLDNCPHDWLFYQCAAVVHHGGAGTTAAGLRAACPTTIVPFFGDQTFWGERLHEKGLAPAPIPIEEFSLDKLVAAINFMLDPEVKQRAVELAKAMEDQDGVTEAVNAFHKHYPGQKAKLEREKQRELQKANPLSHMSIMGCFGRSDSLI